MKIGITGSLSSGKSSVAKILSKNKSLFFSADKVVKNLYLNSSFKKKISTKFRLKNNNIKKQIKLKLINREISLKDLASITHPIVRKKMREFYKKNKTKEIIFFEIPLLIESKLTKYFDVIIFVGAKKNIRLRRYTAKGGDKKIFTILEKRQNKPSKKIKISDHIIYNNKSLRNLEKNVKFLITKYERNNFRC